MMSDFVTLAASSDKRNVTVWAPGVRPSFCLPPIFFSNVSGVSRLFS